MTDTRDPTNPIGGCRDWVRPTLTFVGKIEDVVRGGEGKITRIGGDPGDTKKPNVAQ